MKPFRDVLIELYAQHPLGLTRFQAAFLLYPNDEDQALRAFAWSSHIMRDRSTWNRIPQGKRQPPIYTLVLTLTQDTAR